MKYISLCIGLFILGACNNNSVQVKETDGADSTSGNTSTATTATPDDYSGCYRQVLARDTILLNLKQDGMKFSGQLAFDNFEKDASHGTVSGRLENGLIIMWYDFFSEGSKSVMEVVYRPVDKGMVRGVGEMRSQGDTVRFGNYSQLEFDTSNTLRKIQCVD